MTHHLPNRDVPAQEKSIGRPPAAATIRRALAQSRVVGIRIIGHPGSGKTELLEATLKHLPSPKRVAVIVINPASNRDVDRLQPLCGFAAGIDSAIPDAASVWHVISPLTLDLFDIVLIEAAGGLAPLNDLGQDKTVAVFAVSGGDDKAAEYHNLLGSASAILLTKSDLRPLVKFDPEVFRRDVRAFNPSADVYETSAKTLHGLNDWIAWIEQMRIAKRKRSANPEPDQSSAETFIG
jgi:hydrogenase nickel incorporation protein HypB